jgi:hypothetical protein
MPPTLEIKNFTLCAHSMRTSPKLNDNPVKCQAVTPEPGRTMSSYWNVTQHSLTVYPHFSGHAAASTFRVVERQHVSLQHR